MNKIILDLCGGSGAWSYPYLKNGYDVRTVTLPDNDVRTYIPPANVYGILAAPPCTEFSFVKNEKLPRDLVGAKEIVDACLTIVKVCKPKFWALENPVGHIYTILGKPKMTFQPWEFGDPWTKRTAIWGEFNAPVRRYSKWEEVQQNKDLYIRPGRSKPNMVWLHKSAKKLIPAYAHLEADTDAAFRALTPQGFAWAFYEANQ